MRSLMLLLLFSFGIVSVSAQTTEFALYASPNREVAFYYPSEWNVEWDGRYAILTNTSVYDETDPNSIRVTVNGEADQKFRDFGFELANRLRAGITSNEQTTTAEGFPVWIGRYDAAPIQVAVFGVILEQVAVESLGLNDPVDTMTLEFRGMYNILDSYQSEIQYMVDTLHQAHVEAANASPPNNPSLLDSIPDISSAPITPQTARSLVGDTQIDFRSRVFSYNPVHSLVLNISPIRELVSVYRTGIEEPLVQFPFSEFDGDEASGSLIITGRITADATRLILATSRFFYLYDLKTQQMTSIPYDGQDVVTMSGTIDTTGTLAAFYSPRNESVEVLSVTDGSPYASFPVQALVENIEFSPDGAFLAADQMVDQQGRVLVWDSLLKSTVGSILVDLPIRNSGFSLDGRYYTFSTGRALQVWDSTAGLMITLDSPIPQTPQDGGRRMPFGFSSDSRFITYGVPNGSIEVFDLEAGEPTQSIPVAHDGLIGAIAFNNAGTLIASARQITGGIEPDFELRLWEVQTGTLVHELIVDFGSIMNIRTIMFSSDDQELLLVATENNNFYYRRFIVSP